MQATESRGQAAVKLSADYGLGMELSWPTSRGEIGRKGDERDEEEIISMPSCGTAADRGSRPLLLV